MKNIKVDDEVYKLLEIKAIPFKETTPNDTLRRLLGLNNQKKQENHTKTKKTKLSQLIETGKLQEGQILEFKHDGLKFDHQYSACVSGNELIYENKRFSMSGLVKHIFEKEGMSIPSKSYRGPLYWFTSDGTSIKDLWGMHLDS
jgi:hypothetical protein